MGVEEGGCGCSRRVYRVVVVLVEMSCKISSW